MPYAQRHRGGRNCSRCNPDCKLVAAPSAAAVSGAQAAAFKRARSHSWVNAAMQAWFDNAPVLLRAPPTRAGLPRQKAGKAYPQAPHAALQVPCRRAGSRQDGSVASDSKMASKRTPRPPAAGLAVLPRSPPCTAALCAAAGAQGRVAAWPPGAHALRSPALQRGDAKVTTCNVGDQPQVQCNRETSASVLSTRCSSTRHAKHGEIVPHRCCRNLLGTPAHGVHIFWLHNALAARLGTSEARTWLPPVQRKRAGGAALAAAAAGFASC